MSTLNHGIENQNTSFDQLFKRLSPVIKRIACRLRGNFTSFDEDDLYQEALFHLWTSFNDGRLSDKTDSYILQGCYFYLKNHLRKVKDKNRMISLDELVAAGGENGDLREFLSFESGGTFLADLHSRMLAEKIMNNGFTAREKMLLSFFAEGLTVRQIGQRLGVSHVAVIKARDKIREKCRVYLDKI
jgi:RNA polymerase sigma factor (sigma-70 family)